MPLRDTAPFGAPCWADLQTSDAVRAKDFYTGLFGWSAETSGPEYGGYVMFFADGAPIAGLVPSSPEDSYNDVWTTYLATTDTDATVAVAIEAGAQVLMEPMTVPDQGRMAVFADPTGAVIAVWQPGGHEGFGRINEASTPVWTELSTRDFDTSMAFYKTVFDWQTQRLSGGGEFRYSTAEFDGVSLAGVFDAARFLPAGVPSNWQTYWGVPDTDVAVARVIGLGGSVPREPWDSPHGRMAQVADPQGAVFMLSSV